MPQKIVVTFVILITGVLVGYLFVQSSSDIQRTKPSDTEERILTKTFDNKVLGVSITIPNSFEERETINVLQQVFETADYKRIPQEVEFRPGVVSGAIISISKSGGDTITTVDDVEEFLNSGANGGMSDDSIRTEIAGKPAIHFVRMREATDIFKVGETDPIPVPELYESHTYIVVGDGTFVSVILHGETTYEKIFEEVVQSIALIQK